MDFQSISKRIEHAYAGLSPQLKRAAKNALDNPDEVALKSMRQFASDANVHPSTMLRLTKQLGFKKYSDFQAPFQKRLRTKPSNLYPDNAKSIQQRGPDGAQSMFEEMMTMEHENLTSIVESIGFDDLLDCTNKIAKASHVYVAGVRSCYPAAFYFQYMCRLFKDNVSLLDARGGTFADDLRGASKGDVLLVISVAPYSRNIVQAVEYASSNGCQIIAITDSSLSPLMMAKNTTPILLKPSASPFFHSTLSIMAVVQSLALLLLANGGKKTQNQLSKSKDQLKAFDAYWPDEEPKRESSI